MPRRNVLTMNRDEVEVAPSEHDPVSTKTDIKIQLRFNRNVSLASMAKYMAEISEDECAMAVMEFVDSAYKGESLEVRAQLSSKILGFRRTQNVQAFETLIVDLSQRSKLA
mmetsp:Transcript_44787/g.62750  ORF Transcript_44787/g.62750 Transcript_44787/m.62750 type:complete len:111 (+) Transcript_44787:72-404(+)